MIDLEHYSGHESRSAKSANGSTLWGFKLIKRINSLFVIFVIIPVIISGIYFTFIASDVYLSESSFIVRSHNNQSGIGGIGAILQVTGIGRAQDDTYTVNAYLQSRDAISLISRKLDLYRLYSSHDIDFFSRFNAMGWNGSLEAFYQYMQKKITANLDNNSAISILKVRAYDPEIATNMNEALLTSSENLINRLNERARNDMIGFAEQQVKQARKNVEVAAENLYQFRIANNIFDLNRQTEAQMLLISKLQDVLISVQTQLTQIQALTSENPQISALRAREVSLKNEIDLQLSKIFGINSQTMSNNSAEYESLSLENKLATEQLVIATSALESAKNEAQKKQLYLERISQPNLADAPSEPQRALNILVTLLIGLLVYGILRLFVVSVKEYRD